MVTAIITPDATAYQGTLVPPYLQYHTYHISLTGSYGWDIWYAQEGTQSRPCSR